MFQRAVAKAPERYYPSDFCLELARGSRIAAVISVLFIVLTVIISFFQEPWNWYVLVGFDLLLGCVFIWALVGAHQYDLMANEALVREVLES